MGPKAHRISASQLNVHIVTFCNYDMQRLIVMKKARAPLKSSELVVWTG